MTINKDLLAEKIELESKWNGEYVKNGYTLDLLAIEIAIREVKKRMVFEDHAQAKREIKSPDEQFAVAS